MPNDEILAAEAAAMAGIKPDTFYGYINRKDPITGEPKPTAPAAVRQVGSIKLWDRKEIEEWITHRPGQGRVAPGRVRKARGTRVAPEPTEATD